MHVVKWRILKCLVVAVAPLILFMPIFVSWSFVSFPYNHIGTASTLFVLFFLSFYFDVVCKTNKEWISVDDRLPGTDTGHLEVKNGKKIEKASFIDCEEGYYFCIGQDTRQTWQPTHWRPLPEPPKEEGYLVAPYSGRYRIQVKLHKDGEERRNK